MLTELTLEGKISDNLLHYCMVNYLQHYKSSFGQCKVKKVRSRHATDQQINRHSIVVNH